VIDIPDNLLGREIDLGEVHVTAEMIEFYRAAIGAPASGPPSGEAPATFCLALRRGMQPDLPLPPDTVGLYGGNDMEFRRPIRAGKTYRISARLADVYEKSGRSGTFVVIEREALVREVSGELAARIIERQIVRPIPQAAARLRANGDG